MKIACLHTMESNIPLFDAVRPEGVELEHHVRADLLQRALAAGGAGEDILEEAAEALRALSSADGVLLTCSTIGLAAARAGAARVDEALAREAADKAQGGRIAALVTAPSTVEPTRELFESVAAGTGATVEIVLIEGAIEKFQAGDLDDYARMVAEAADACDADVVALAQASMAPAAALAKRETLTSPGAGLTAVVRAAGG